MSLHDVSQLAAGLVADDREAGLFRVDRRAFVDADLLTYERSAIFDASWLYVGHGSELPEPGSFLTRRVAGRPCIFQRDSDGCIRLFFNTCPHRGNALCKEAAGKTRSHVCFYHGWNYNTQGELIGVTDAAGYSAAFDKSAYPLGGPPRLEQYRGLYFMSMKSDIMPLRDYLGAVTDYLDLMLDQDDGQQISPGQQKYHFRANWKLYAENSFDGYHAAVTHRRYVVDFVRDMGANPSAWSALLAPDNPENSAIAFAQGHAVIENPIAPGAIPISDKGGEYLAARRAVAVVQFGEERARRMYDFSRNIFIFPSLFIIAHFRSMRTFYPNAIDSTDVDSWTICGKDDSDEFRRIRHDNFLSFQGPGGFATPDDVEALENCQRGFAAKEVKWSDISRGMKRRPVSTDELQMRTFWRAWYARVNPNYTVIPEHENMPPELQYS